MGMYSLVNAPEAEPGLALRSTVSPRLQERFEDSYSFKTEPTPTTKAKRVCRVEVAWSFLGIFTFTIATPAVPGRIARIRRLVTTRSCSFRELQEVEPMS